jgi:hypothetical protein
MLFYLEVTRRISFFVKYHHYDGREPVQAILKLPHCQQNLKFPGACTIKLFTAVIVAVS